MDIFWRSFIIALLLAIYYLVWQEKEAYKDMYLYQLSAKEELLKYNRSLEDSNINILSNCSDSIIAKIK